MSARTTYSDLTTRAAHELTRGLHLAQGPQAHSHPAPNGDLDLAKAIDAHRDLSAALAHLGRVLTLPPGGTGSRTRRGSSAGTADARLVRGLEARAAARDWSEPDPAEASVAGALCHAARLIRAAADLWTTHHTPGGAPRSPEAARMRHPSVLGAATRQWHDLVVVAGAVADQLTALAETSQPDETWDASHDGTAGRPELHPGPSVAAVRDYPRPASRPAAHPAGLVDLTVARPTPIAGGDPLTDTLERLAQVHRTMWLLAEAGTAPAPVLANAAAIGTALAQSAEAAQRRASAAAQPGAARDGHLAAADAARRTCSLWRAVATQLEPLRTPHPATSAVQIHRVELARALACLTSGPPEDLEPTARALSRASQDYADLAELGLRALRTAHERGEIYLLGRALPNEALTRRPDLLQAKLAGHVVPAPTVVVRRLEAAYRAIVRDRSGSSVGGGSSPAA